MQHPAQNTRPMSVREWMILTHSSALVRYVLLPVMQFSFKFQLYVNIRKEKFEGKEKLKVVWVVNTKIKLLQPSVVSCGFLQCSCTDTGRHDLLRAFITLNWNC